MADSFSLPAFFASRAEARRAFADANGHAGSDIVPLHEDMASRRFYRVGGAVLMDSVPDGHPFATIGHGMRDFIRIAQALRDNGVYAPHIYAADPQGGFLLMEDLGDAEMEEPHFEAAIAVLKRLRGGFLDNDGLLLPDYFSSHIHARHDRVVHWYAPCVRGRHNPDGWVEEYHSIWRGIERQLPPPLTGFVHADFARHNLRRIKGVCGVLDFQGAQWGPVAYDLVNLLEDGRIETSPRVKQEMYRLYTADLSEDERAVFAPWYAVLSAQFHLRLAGQFIKLALTGGKPRYLDHLPLVQQYLREELAHPALAPLTAWFDRQGIGFDDPVMPDPAYIRPDAL